MEGRFHEILKKKVHNFVTYCYKITGKFTKSELYGTTSQLRRASMSIMLNYIEGYARKRDKVKLNFYETSHGFSQESKYIIYFAKTQNWMDDKEYKDGLEMIDEIGRMLWSTIDLLEKKINI